MLQSNAKDCNFSLQSKTDEDKPFVLEPYMEKINELFGGDTVEDIFNQLEKDGSEWSLNQLNLLKKMVSAISCLSYLNMTDKKNIDYFFFNLIIFLVSLQYLFFEY